MTDEEQIRDLIERWATAVHAGDMAGVLAGHAEGIVMFDVPPPEQGVRGRSSRRRARGRRIRCGHRWRRGARSARGPGA